jgi:signal transduction histidine kinase
LILTFAGVQRTFDLRIDTISGHDNRLLNRVAMMVDITERKKAEAESLQLREKAEMSSRLAAIGEMAAGIAHEINNPLTGVIGFSELLLSRDDLPDDIKENLKIIADGGKRVKDIVRRMLTFARQNKPVKTNANIHELIDNTLEIRSYVLRTANIVVTRSYDPSLPWVTVDPGQMQQVFLNLIVNAEYAMKKAHGKGTLTITTGKADDHIRIAFKDDGTGMDQNTREKLFNPFFTTKQVNEGTGLGLSLSRSILLEHGGTIEVESEPGQGTTFIITLPVTSPPEEAIATGASSLSASPVKVKSAHILVVDDEVAIMALVKALLVKEGHIVDVTDDATVAFEKLGSERYDAVLMDIRMPGTSGVEIHEKITLAHPELAGKFLFITGDTSDANTRDFLEKNELLFITKPFDKETLLKKVNELL